MDPLPTFMIFSLGITSILSLLCIQQVFITPLQSKPERPLFTMRLLNLVFGSTETVYIILCLIEYQNANKSISEARFIFEMIRYIFLSVTLLIFTFDRLKYLYQIHINQCIPLWIRTVYITLCSIFNLTLLITFGIALYSHSAFYWQIQLIHLRCAVVIVCAIAIIAIAHIYYEFNQKIQLYLDTILSQHNQLQQIENINHKLLDTHRRQSNATLTKEDILANNLNLAVKIRSANHKLVTYILLIFVCGLIDFVYIPIGIKRILNTDNGQMHSLTVPYVLNSNAEYILQRLLFMAILSVLIYDTYDQHSLFKILFRTKRKKDRKLCVITCLNGSLLSIICYEMYLCLMYAMHRMCPCCITQFCFNLRQHIYDIKKYQSYFGHLPKTKKNKFIMVPNTNMALNNESDIESLPSKQPSQSNRNTRAMSHGIFDSPPHIIQQSKQRRASQVSVCGVPMLKDNVVVNEFGLSDTDSAHNSDLSYDLAVAQQIIDNEADNDCQYLSDAQSEQYDSFADIMIQKERDFFQNKNNPKSVDKHRRQSVEMRNPKKPSSRRGSIANLGKKRRGSLILSAVDNIKSGFKYMKEIQNQKKESKKEAQFMESQKNKLMHIENYSDLSSDDEKEYYNVKAQSSHKHKRSKDRLSSMRNSLKSIIPSRYSKEKLSKKNESPKWRSESYNNYEPFQYNTETMIIHSSDDNISIATYGTAKDCLESDFESELNALNVSMNGQSVSPNRSIRSYNAEMNVTNVREESVSLSLESISASNDSEEMSPPPPRIIKKGNGRGRKGSVPLAQIQESGGESSEVKYNVSVTSGDDFSCDDMMTEAVL